MITRNLGTVVRKSRKALATALAMVGMLATLQTVHAAPVFAYGAVNNVNFGVAQNVVDVDSNGVLSPGDLVYGILNVTRVTSGGSTLWDANNVPGPGVDSFSGYYLGAVQSVTPLPTPWTAAVTLGAASVDPNGVMSAADLAAHAVAKLFVDTGTPFESNGSVADDIAKAMDGTPWVTLGFAGGYWNALGFTNGTIIANGGFNALTDPAGLPLRPIQDPSCSTCPAVDFYFTTVATLSTPGAAWQAMGSSTGAFSVPEPSIMSLGLAGWLAWAVARGNRRRRDPDSNNSRG
jgi:hypothetical protein